MIAKASIVEFIWDGEIGTDFDGARYAMIFHIAKDLMALARRIDARLRCRGEACGRGGRLYLAEVRPAAMIPCAAGATRERSS